MNSAKMAVAWWLLTLLTLLATCSASNLPIVDLGYALHRASSFNVSPANAEDI